MLELTERELIGRTRRRTGSLPSCMPSGLHRHRRFRHQPPSLTYLQTFQVDFLKIDQSFVGMIGSDALSSHIVENVIDLATRLGLQLVAEGVENQVQADYLKARG